MLSLLGVAVTEFCRECQALISSCVWLIQLQGRAGMSVVLLVRADLSEPAGLSLEQDTGVRAGCFSQQPGQNLGVAVELSFASLSMGSYLLLSVLGCVCVTPAAGGRRGTGALGQGCH